MVEKTSTGYAPWEVVAAEDARYRDAAVADLLLRTLERENADSDPAPPAENRPPPPRRSACRARASFPRSI